MSFFLDVPMLYAQGAAFGALAPEELQAPAPRRALAAGTLAVFYGVSGALYFERPASRLIWRAFRADGGRDFMWSSGFLPVPKRARSPVLAAAIFLTYPLWLAAGYRRGRRS